MNIRDVIIFVLCILVLYLFLNNNKSEHLTSLSNEALQSLASVYNTNSLSVSNLTVTGSFNLLPYGVIVAWYYTTVPQGWAICDGKNGTPDLRSRFILGAGQGAGLTNRQIASYGGEENHVLTVNEIPAHAHTYPGDDWLSTFGAVPVSNINLDYSQGGGHGHFYNTSNTGGGAGHNNMPPYYVLTYIMKI